MHSSQPFPAGPRGAIGAAAEAAVAGYLRRCGWVVLGRNLRIGRDEIDILAREPPPTDTLVVVEVRARSRPGFGAAVETVDAGKVRRLYRAAWALRAHGHPALATIDPSAPMPRVDLVTVVLDRRGRWRLEQHLCGIQPP